MKLLRNKDHINFYNTPQNVAKSCNIPVEHESKSKQQQLMNRGSKNMNDYRDS